jgi:uncharacterized protein (DUF1684 family)
MIDDHQENNIIPVQFREAGILMRRPSKCIRLHAIAVAAASLFAGSCDSISSAGFADNDAYLAEIEKWRSERVERLKGPDGYLNLVGLFWLRQDTSTFGSSPDNDFVLPARAAPKVGAFHREREKVVMTVEDGVKVFHGQAPVRSIVMDDDYAGLPVVLSHGSLAWTVIRRDDKFAVRVRDFENPAVAEFQPIEYFPVDVSLRVSAALERFDKPRQLRVDTVITGLDYRPQSPGKLAFDIAGQSYELEAYQSGERLFLIFGDTTSGRQTYPAGRFLYADMPDEAGVTILDFNKAYNPPCAFNEFATCPVASPQNRLKTKILAGERFDPSMHVPGSTH